MSSRSAPTTSISCAHAAGRDWSKIDPSILGTLFERGLDLQPSAAGSGAHYTDRDKIMLIVRPTIIEPLEAERPRRWRA